MDRVKPFLERFGATCEVAEVPASTRFAAETAAALGYKLEQIAKSIVFRGAITERPILVIAGGRHRVGKDKVQAALADPISKADVDFVRRRTGFALAGVPSVGHSEGITRLVDESLRRFDTVWAAAGTLHAVFKTTFAELKRWSGDRLGDFKV